jgi:hypothetical protein
VANTVRSISFIAVSFIAVSLIVGLIAVESQLAGDAQARAVTTSGFKRYVNDKYGYSVDYPGYLIPQGEPDAHDGQKFSSTEHPLKMMVWGYYSNWLTGEEMTIDDERKWALAHLDGDELPSAKLTYQAGGKNWFVLSGVSQKNVFYQRTIATKEAFVTVLIIYPAARKGEFDQTVSHIAASLKG